MSDKDKNIIKPGSIIELKEGHNIIFGEQMPIGSKFDDFLKDENIEIDEEKIKENIEQMTDKEIIINGIDVSGCGYYYEIDGQCNIFGMGKSGEDTFCRYCTDNPNCYYKKLKQLEQENAELKAYMDVNEDFKTAWEELKAENERLKEEKKP